ncbi:MAG: hypothetical protein WC889_11795 [Myxococcota bacterium]|jgi:hypothetical protein
MTLKFAASVTAFMAAMAVAAPQPFAAEFTRIVGAAYPDAKFQMEADVPFVGLYQWSRITREYNRQYPPIDALGLDFAESEYLLIPRLDIGLYRDLELYLKFPVVIQWVKTVSMDPSTKGYTSFTLNRQNRPGMQPSDAIVNVSGQSSRSGFGDMSVGLRYAIFNDQRPNHTLNRDKNSTTDPVWWDDTVATWIVDFEYTAPTGSQIDPTSPNGGVGRKNHVLTFSTSASKRFRYADPYFGIFYSLPIPVDKDDPAIINAGQRGGFVVGTEIIPYEDHKAGHKFAFDLRMGATYVGNAGREQNEMSEFFPGKSFFQKDDKGNYVYDSTGYPIIANSKDFGRLKATEQFLEITGQLGLYFVAAKYFKFSSYVGFGHNTLHFLTCDDLGVDKNGDGKINPGDGDTLNPNYEAELDQRGNRFRLADTFNMFWSVTLTGQF